MTFDVGQVCPATLRDGYSFKDDSSCRIVLCILYYGSLTVLFEYSGDTLFGIMN